MTDPKPIVYENIDGKTLDIFGMQAVAAMTRKPKPKKEAPAEFHKGWRVQGHPPGAMEEARALAEAETARWLAHSDAERTRRLTEGQRAPEPWNESKWRREFRKKPVRSKPYDIPDAAKLCADMATKAGWLDIEVAELKRSKVGA